LRTAIKLPFTRHFRASKEELASPLLHVNDVVKEAAPSAKKTGATLADRQLSPIARKQEKSAENPYRTNAHRDELL
jgi:hypothetical protein